MTPLELRSRVPAFEDVAYLNFGAHGPSPRSVVEAASQMLADHEYQSGTSDPYTTAYESYERARKRIAAHIGADPVGVALTESTVDGITRIAGAIEWEPGDVVVRTDLEHPAGVLPWHRLKREGVEVRVVPTTNGRIDHDAYKAAVADAKLVCFSAITWTHGTKLPVSELVDIAADAGAFTLVDAVQVPGQQAMDVTEWGADAVAAAGHKWLLGPWGSGFLAVDPDTAEELVPQAVGYRSVESMSAADPSYKYGAKRFEVGTTSPAPHAGLVAALDAIEAVGVAQIASRIEMLTDRLKDGLESDQLLSPSGAESGLVSVAVENPKATVDRLAGEDIIIRSLPEMDAIRLSVHATTTTDEIAAVVDALG